MSSTAAATQVAELVRALALGWKNLAAYPPGHPALSSSLDLVHRRLDDLRGPAGDVVLGIESDGLLYGADKIDSASAQKFAQALYARGVAVLRFTNATDARDIEAFLRILAAGTPVDQKRPIWDELSAAGVINITLQPVDYSSVQVTDDLSAPLIETKLPSLWEEVLRAMMEGRELSTEAEEFLAAEQERSAEEVSRMILKYVDSATSNKPTFDPDATFGVRMPVHGETPEAIHDRLAEAVAQHILRAKGAAREKSLEQAIELLGTLPNPLRKTVIRKIAEVLATDESAASQLRELAAALPQDEVLEALRYLASIQKLSDHALNLLQSLSVLEASTQAELPSENVVKDLVEIFGEDDIDRFNPPDHAALLAQVTIHIPTAPTGVTQTTERLGKRVETVANDALTRQLGRTIVELVASLGASRSPQTVLTRLEGLFRSHLTAGEFEEALELVHRLQEIATSTANDDLRHNIQESFVRLATPEMIRALVESLYNAPPEKTRSIQRLVESVGGGARRNLLVALTEETNRSRRRRLFDFIASLGPMIVPEVTGFVTDSRWFVVRNMVVLLRTVNDRTSLPEVRKLAQHGDIRVRMEAIKSLFTLDTNVPPQLLENVIRDRDPKVSEAAITLIGSYGIKEGVQPLLRVLEGKDVFGGRRTQRVKSIRALGELGDASALPGLQHFFGDAFFFWPWKEERYAAWESLAGYPKDARAPLVEKGLQSRDPNIREICVRISQG
ncbi:MAG TPA: HEAT repeat domain-containing protein [Thermoanaerobaculia bacterium]|nr:HEAT repeat domain-containing protein [Thermoanaerobaculia bacterium]